MTDKKLTDNEIIKALECCFMEQQCNYCPIFKEHSADCLDTVLENAHALITRQQAENENLKVENQSLRSAANSLKMHYEEAQAEIENLKNKNFILSQKRANIFEITDAYGRGKSEAVKEFAERLKCGVPQEYGVIRCSDVDNLVKEMVGESNSDE